MNLKTHSGIAREYKRVSKMVARKKSVGHEHSALQGAMQALAWVLGDNAQAPHKAFPLKNKS